jgi:hypothetical protein
LRKISIAPTPDLDPLGNPSHSEGPSDYAFFAQPQGTIRAAMIFVDFSDAPAGSLTTQQAADHVLGRENFPSLGKRYAFQRLYNEESYGKLTVDVEVRSDLGWRRMPKPSSSQDYNFSMTGKDRFNAQKNYITDAARLFTPLFGAKLISAAHAESTNLSRLQRGLSQRCAYPDWRDTTGRYAWQGHLRLQIHHACA